MEHHVQSVDDALIGGLSYKLKAGASYVTDRRSVTFFASGGNQYSSAGVKVMRFNLASDSWMDPSTFRIQFQLNNKSFVANGTNFVLPLSWNPAVFFRRCRIIAGGQVIEDIDDFNRLSLMLTALKPQDEQLGIANEGFGSFDEDVNQQYADYTDTRRSFHLDDALIAGTVNEARQVLFKPMLGILNQDKHIPLRYCPLQIELELVSDPAEAVYVGSKTAANAGIYNYVANWDITDIQCKVDLLTLDSSLQNEYASHLLSGKSLPLNFSSWNHSNQATGNDKNFSAHINRSLTRLKGVFITLLHPSTDGGQYKVCNNFFHPLSLKAYLGSNINDQHDVWLQVGSKLFPEYPVKSCNQAMYELKKAVGHQFHIYNRWYRTHQYIIGFDTERVAGAGFTGLNTKAGDLMTVNFRNCDNEESVQSVPSRVYIALNYDAVLNIRDSGVELLD